MTKKRAIDDKIAAADSGVSNRIKELERLVELQSKQLSEARGSTFSIPVGQPKKPGRSYVRVIIPDTHGAHLDSRAARAFLEDLEHLKPAQIVRLGDHIDCGGFLAQHHTLGFVPETSYSFEEDVAAAITFLDETQRRAPGAEDWYIVGNHEQRIEKWIIKETLRHPKDSKYLFDMFGCENVLSLKERGIRVVKRDKCYNGLRKRGTLKLGKCLFHHGTRVGKYAAVRNADDVGTNIVFGHTHRIATHIRETANGTIGSWSFGCLCGLHPLYGDTGTSDWAHGYGIQVVMKSGRFMTIQVPIINGQSLLKSLIASIE